MGLDEGSTQAKHRKNEFPRRRFLDTHVQQSPKWLEGFRELRMPNIEPPIREQIAR
jgi:hypothetical protein